MFNIFQKTKRNAGISESGFSCDREGLTIRGTEYRPNGNHLPAAIVSHGFMTNQGSVRRYAKQLAELGCASYCFDFNGGCLLGGKSDRKTTEMSVLTEVMDLEAVIDHVAQLPYVDDKHIFLMGCSQGGFVSALTAASRKEQISRLVLFYPALCVPDDARAGKMLLAKFDPRNVPERINCGPMKLGRRYVTDVLDMDPFAEIIPYPGPVLIIHGTSDSIVHPDYARRAYEAYRGRPDTDAPTYLEMIEGSGHGFSKRRNKFVMERVARFISD